MKLDDYKKHVGDKALFRYAEGISFEVWVLDVKQGHGIIQALIKPVSGHGEKLVNSRFVSAFDQLNEITQPTQ